MAWNENNQGPWGNRGDDKWQKKSSSQSNGFEKWIGKVQNKFGENVPKNYARLAGIGIIIAIVLWLGTGFYYPKVGENAVVLRFGKYVATTHEGLHWHLPYPIEEVVIKSVAQIHQVNNTDSESSPVKVAIGDLREAEDQPLMLTGDENIADVHFTVQWYISDLYKYLFKAKDPDLTVKIAAESIVREIIAQTPFADVLTKGRGTINLKAQEMLQKLCDEYQLGIHIKELSLQRVEPPAPVIDAFRNVQRAKAIKEEKIHKAEGYHNSVIPKAEGDAIEIIQAAEAYKAERIARATGESGRFKEVLAAYQKNPKTTETRLRLETVQKVLEKAPKVFFDSGTSAGLRNVIPHMALPALQPPTTSDKGDNQ